VRPQTLFPAVITMRDATVPLFFYVLNNVLRARRYGAQTTRTGTMTNHLVSIALADGEIFSNLYFTQHLYDALKQRDAIHPAQPIATQTALQMARDLVPMLLGQEAQAVYVSQHLSGADLTAFLAEHTERTRTEDGMRELLQAAQRDSSAYFDSYIQKSGKGKKK
jgi:CRISPR-associated protein Csc2